MSGIAESVFFYNPILMKRIGTGPDFPGQGGYHIWGPSQDDGRAYGSWWDKANGFGVLSTVDDDGIQIYSPASGEPMVYEGPASEDMVAAISGYKGDYYLLPASQTGQTCLTSAPIYDAKLECAALFNPHSGEDVTEEYRKMKEAKNATKATAASGKKMSVGPGMGSLPNSVDKPDLKATGLPVLDATKPVKPSNDVGKNKLDKLNSHGTDEKSVEKAVKPSSIKPVGNDKVKIPDVSKASKSVAEMSDEELLDAVEAHLVSADGEGGEELHISIKEGDEPELSLESDEDKGEAGMSMSEEGKPPMPPAPPPSMPPESMPPPDGMPPPEGGELPPLSQEQESEIPVLSDDLEEPAEGYLGANAALVKKLRSTAAALRNGVAVEEKELKRLMATASQVLRGAKPDKKDDMRAELNELKSAIAKLTKLVVALPQPSMPGQQPPMSTPEAGGPVCEPGKMSAEDKLPLPPDGSQLPPDGSQPPMSPDQSAPPASPPAGDSQQESHEIEQIMQEPDEAEGVHFEVLQSIDKLEQEGISAAAIDCRLYGDGSANPFWNVTANGEPLARIFLQDQDRPEEIKSLFVSPQYGEAIAKASEQVRGGLRQVLADAKARYFTLEVDRVDLAKRAQAAAKKVADKVVADTLVTIQNRFLECMATAAIGFDRNFFSGGNDLKDAFFQTLGQHGISEKQAVRVVEAAFAEGSAKYFKALAKKATDLLGMEPQAFQQLRASILEAGVIMPVVEETNEKLEDQPTLANHLANANVLLAAVGGAQQVDEREQLRRDLGFAPRK